MVQQLRVAVLCVTLSLCSSSRSLSALYKTVLCARRHHRLRGSFYTWACSFALLHSTASNYTLCATLNNSSLHRVYGPPSHVDTSVLLQFNSRPFH